MIKLTQLIQAPASFFIATFLFGAILMDSSSRLPEGPNARNVEICVLHSLDISTLQNRGRLYVAIRIPTFEPYHTEVSKTATWNYALPNLPLKLSTLIHIEIAERRLIRNKMLATADITVEELMQLVDENNIVILPMNPQEPDIDKATLTLTLKVERMDLAVISTHMAGRSQSNPRTSNLDLFDQTIRRLQTLARLSAHVAKIHPLSNTVFSLAACIVKIAEAKINMSTKLRKLVLHINSVLQFVELAEAESRIKKFQDVVDDLLCCIARCIMFISNVENIRPGPSTLLSDGNPQIEKLQNELTTLEFRMSQSITLGAARTISGLGHELDAIHERQLYPMLHPLSMATTLATTCFPGTRSKVLADLAQWALLSSYNSSNILWLYAHAGSGKSTIATTLANLFDSVGCLGSFVFFDRKIAERSEPTGMVRTIAYQLASRRQEFAPKILGYVKQRPSVADSAIEVQFQNLLVAPLTTVPSDGCPVIIIIDALDEGGTEGKFLSVLSREMKKFPKHVRIIITSRKDPKIERALSTIDNLHIYDLDQDAEIHDDIRTYISAQLEEVRQQYASELPSEWPPSACVDGLVRQANGLFIWANVACSYIRKYRPNRQLETLLINPASLAETETSLDDLYEIALGDAGDWRSHIFAKEMHDTLGVILISQNPQSPQSISDVLGIETDIVVGLISRLQSVLKTDQHGCIHVVHPSFHDYLVDPRRCDRTHAWFIHPEDEQSLMASRCIQLLKRSLKKNIMAMESPASWPWDIPTLPDSQTYAAMSWTHHVCQVVSPFKATALVEVVNDFLSEHLLHWIELLILRQQSTNAIVWLEKMQTWHSQLNIEVQCGSHPLLVYETALPFCPKMTTISANFPISNVQVSSAILESWSPCMMILSGHKTYADYLSVAATGDLVASGSHDGCVNIWSTSLGTRPFPAVAGGKKTAGLIAIIFASDGHQLITGYLNGRINFWDVVTGGLVKEVRVRSGEELSGSKKTDLVCVAMARDNYTIACGFQDGLVQIWNMTRDPTIPLLSAHQGKVHTVAFSSNQEMVASGAADNLIRVWNSHTGTPITTLVGHTKGVSEVAFLPEGKPMLASVSFDGTLRIWDVLTGCMVHTCCVNAPVRSLAVSHHSSLIATGSSDSRIRIWDSQSGREVYQSLLLHRDQVMCLKFSSDDKILISGSSDTQVRIWSVEQMRPQSTPEPPRHEKQVICIALAHNGMCFVSGALDGSLIVWKTSDGTAALPCLKHHRAPITSVEFSVDNAWVISGSEDQTVCIWNTETGDMVFPPLLHSSKVMSLNLSRDKTKLVALIGGEAFTVWDLSTRESTLVPLPSFARKATNIALSSDATQVAILHFVPGDLHDGLGFVIVNTLQGNVLVEHKIETETKASTITDLKIGYTTDGRHLIIRYGCSDRGKVTKRAFNSSTGKECLEGWIPECRVLVAQDNEIFGSYILRLPLDLNYMANIMCWDSTEDIIVIGTFSGDVYAVKFRK
ncbi:hypothetical protein C8J57DRAFT_1504302 [Mycena rebaudengoi]|nr:hypothetical protein C8J57DRAFT_1504302 [Mycena rebaudengoi]